MKQPDLLYRSVTCLSDIEDVCQLHNEPDVKVLLADKDDNNDSTFYGFDDVCSWRGSYSEPAIITGSKQSVPALLELLNKLYTETFYGYKGGEYYYGSSDELWLARCESDGSGRSCTHAIYSPEDKTLTFVFDKEY